MYLSLDQSPGQLTDLHCHLMCIQIKSNIQIFFFIKNLNINIETIL